MESHRAASWRVRIVSAGFYEVTETDEKDGGRGEGLAAGSSYGAVRAVTRSGGVAEG